MEEFDAVIVGAGAAGLMCAISAGRRGRRVLLLDHGERVGAKILISGGGRCNFTNRNIAPERFISANPHFCKSALKRYTQHDFIALVERHGIPYHEKTLGQLFCDGSAGEIIAMLLGECAAAGVDIRLRHSVTDICKDDRFRISAYTGYNKERHEFTAASMVLATGGLSIPKMGATGFAYEMATRFGLAIIPTRPALVPLTAGPDDLPWMQGLSGVSLETIAGHGRALFRENMLFTHRGLSGPAILQISSYWDGTTPIHLDLLPGLDTAVYLRERKQSRPKAELKTILAEVLPNRLAEALTQRFFLNEAGKPMATLTDKALNGIAATLKHWPVTPAGSEGYAKAEVTAGGIDTAALSSKTMEARDVPGLYAIGEAVDVTGWLGGYNFQWAWSSGWVAGEAV